jgi:hypothetical protein
VASPGASTIVHTPALNPQDPYVGERGLRHLLLPLSGGMEEGVGESEGGVMDADGEHWQQLSSEVGGSAGAQLVDDELGQEGGDLRARWPIIVVGWTRSMPQGRVTALG